MMNPKMLSTLYLLFITFTSIFPAIFSSQNELLINKHKKAQTSERYVWSEWSTWTQCSRTCDIGIQKRERTCFDKLRNHQKVTGYYCSGKATEYKTCNLQYCEKDKTEFREIQCQNFNTKPFKGAFYDWKPFLDGTNNCQLLCIPKGQHFYHKFADKVIDGTNCGDDLNGICVDGECRTLGCDGILGSNKILDKCGVCGGDNLSCRLISGLFTENDFERGSHTVTVFPRGSRNINITEIESTENYLSLKTEDDRYILNSDSKIEYSGLYKGAGTEIRYFRRRFINNKDVGESIFIKGPIREPLILQIIYHTDNPGILYFYSMDLNYDENLFPSANLIHKPYLYHRNSSESNNTKLNSYRNNVQPIMRNHSAYYAHSRNSSLVRKFRNMTNTSNQIRNYKEIYNDKQIKNYQNEVSYERNNRYIWIANGYTSCSATCGGGFRSERLGCLDQSNGKIVNHTLCPAVRKPEQNKLICNVSPCPPSWNITDWSACSSTCGSGTQNRLVKCVKKVSADLYNEMPVQYCSKEAKPDTERSCNASCTKWKVGDWQNCQVTCGRGGRLRTVQCIDEFDRPVADANCNGTKPATYQICDMGSCAKVWFYTDWSNECKTSCKKDLVESRKVICGSDLNRNLTSLQQEKSSCDARTKPIVQRKCVLSNTCEGKWFAGEWSECSKTCNEGLRTRAIVCMREETNTWLQAQDSLCDSSKKPNATEICNNGPCKPEWYMSEWSRCSKSCGDGIRTREIKCLDENMQPSLECDLKTRPSYRDYCSKRECPKQSDTQTQESKFISLDPTCKDTLNICHLIYSSNLCTYYKKNCCQTCKQAEIRKT